MKEEQIKEPETWVSIRLGCTGKRGKVERLKS